MSREAFEQAVPFFVETAARVRPDQWETLALGVWSVRDLVGHTSRAMLTVEQYATVGADRTGFGTAGEIAERGRAAGRALGDDPVGAVREIATRVLGLVERLPDDHPMKTPAGERPLVRYLSSRVAELTIHTIDLPSALGVDVEAPAECWRVTLHGLADRAVEGGTAKEVAFALTGRGALADGFTLVP